MSNLIVMGRDDPEIQKKLEIFKSEMDATRDRAKFLTKQLDKLKKDWDDRKGELWREIEARIDEQGYLKDGKKAGDLCLTVDWDTMSVKKSAEEKHPLAELLGSILR